ncbi:MAG TPA: hypothetical protein VG871_13310 [Vicinamibacterales bacterium]|nr:hypothetical protein [Vicinamibacterales bacterium]
MSFYSTQPGGGSLPWMHTVTGSDAALFIEIFAPPPTSVSYAGMPLHLEMSDPGTPRLWSLSPAPPGTAAIDIVGLGNPFDGVAVSYTGVRSGDPVDVSTGSCQMGASVFTFDFPTTADDGAAIVVGTIGNGMAYAMSTSGQTSRSAYPTYLDQMPVTPGSPVTVNFFAGQSQPQTVCANGFGIRPACH